MFCQDGHLDDRTTRYDSIVVLTLVVIYCRHHPGETSPHMAIGPWHARVHKPACQRQFGARCIPESGLTYGDNGEHLWSTLRKTAHLLKYMSMAHRQDALTALVSFLQNKDA